MLEMKLSDISKSVNNAIKFWSNNLSEAPALFIWGAPGIGKSSVIKNIAKQNDMEFVDVRLSQLAPTDLRGLPYVVDGVMSWAPPKFLPSDPDSKGILFLDEFNMATGSMMGIAQQLILDKKVGDYTLPKNWIIVGAGNQASDRAAVNSMPAPVANRFVHYFAVATPEEFKKYVMNYFECSNNTKAQIISFINFRPELLHSNSKTEMAWPSPRTWEWAAQFIDHSQDITPVVGKGAAIQFKAFLEVWATVPDIDAILAGNMSPKLKKPEPSLMFACISSLISKSLKADHYVNALKWILKQGFTEDYSGLFITDSFSILQNSPQELDKFMDFLVEDEDTQEFITKYQELLAGAM